MQLSFLGAAREIGRSGVLLETKNSKVLFDYGVKLTEGLQEPKYPLPVHGFLDAVVLSHAHLDHSGAIPFLFQASEPQVLTHTATVPIMQLLLEDFRGIALLKKHKCFTPSQLKRMMRNTRDISYKQKASVTSDVLVTLRDAGHILGAGITEVEAEDKTLVYSGDFKDQSTYMHQGADLPGKADVLVVEATYGNRDHPPRKEVEKEFIDAIREVIENNGSVLLPCFAVGRTQEIITMLYSHGIEAPVYMDGMSRAVSEIYLEFLELLKDYESIYSAMKWVNWIVAPSQRNHVFNEPSVIVSSAGMLSGGPAVRYIRDIRDVRNSAVFFTGYQIKGTPGYKLLNEKRFETDEFSVSCDDLDIRYFDFSAHAGRDGLQNLIKRVDPKLLLVNHGDDESCESIRQWANDELGCYAFAPKPGEKYSVEDYV